MLKVKFISFHWQVFLKKIQDQRMLSAILLMATGAGASRIVGIASIPILTRIYEPADFGVLSVFMALVFLLNPVVTLRYMLALPLPRSERLAFGLLVLCIFASLINSFFIGGFFLFFGQQFWAAFSMQVLAPFWWLIVFGLIGVSLYDTLVAWCTRKRAYAYLARSQISQAVLGEGAKLTLGVLGVHPMGLLFGNSIGHAFGAIQLLRSFWPSLIDLFLRFKVRHVKHVAYRYRGFPFYRMPAQVLLVFSVHAPTIFAATLYDATTLGYLGIAVLAVALPGLIIGGAVSRAVYGEVAFASSKGISKEKIRRLCAFLFFSSAALLLPAALLFDICIPVVFGSDWSELSDFLAIFILQIPFQLAASPVAELFNFLHKQHHELVFLFCRVALLIFSFLFCSWFSLSAVWFVLFVVVCSALYYSVVILFGLMISGDILNGP